MIRVTVTCLVCATECHATVRSCVTWAAVPGLSVGDQTPQDEREPSARGGTDASVPPLQQLLPFTVALSRDTRMTISQLGRCVLPSQANGGLEWGTLDGGGASVAKRRF